MNTPSPTLFSTEHKRCSCCGLSMPEVSFYPNSTTPDGLSNICRTCAAKKREPRNLAKGTNSALAAFPSRMLIDELRARGYSGTLKYTKAITL